jgi:hypothetical protein
MRICHHCHTHNLELDNHCHSCERSLSTTPTLPWKTALLLGVVSTGCISQKSFVGEPEYGVAMVDQDGDGFYEYNDCDDNDSDVGEPSAWYADTDSDGFGDANDTLSDCEQPQGYVDNDTDCNDQDDTVNPDAAETTGDTIDSNCNGEDDS